MIIVNIANRAIWAVLPPEFVIERTLRERLSHSGEFLLSFGDGFILGNIILQSFSQTCLQGFSLPS